MSVTPSAVYGRLNFALQRDRSKIQLGDYFYNGSELGISSNSPEFVSWGGLHPNPKISLFKNDSGQLVMQFKSTFHGDAGYSPVLDSNGKPLAATRRNVEEATRILNEVYNRYREQINGLKNFPTSSILPPNVIAGLQKAIANAPQNQQENQPPQKQQENQVGFELA